MSKIINAGRILKLLLTLPPLLSLITTLGSLARLEVSLIRRNIFTLYVFSLLMLTTLVVSWVIICAMLIVYFTSLHLGMLLSLGLVLIVNLFLLGLLFLLITNTKLHSPLTKASR